MTSSIGSSGLTSNVPMSYSSVGANFMSSMGGGGVTSSTSSHALTTYDGISSVLCSDRAGGTSAISGLGNVTISTANVSPLPVRAHQMNTMPPLCQVCNFIYIFIAVIVSMCVSVVNTNNFIVFFKISMCNVSKSINDKKIFLNKYPPS